MKTLRQKIALIPVLICAFSWPNVSQAQNLILANPAELTDFRSLFSNPAILSFQNSQVALGGKMFHLGFVDGDANAFRQGYVSLGFPNGISDDMGLGIQAQYFNSPLFSQSNLSFVIARRFHHMYSFGIRFNVFSKSFNQDNFDLVDPDDPVFRNGTTVWAGTFGAGVSVQPLPYLSIGVGVDHINRANISLNSDDVHQPVQANFGAALNLGLFQGNLSVSYEDGEWRPLTSIGTNFRNTGYAMLGFSDNAIDFEGQMRVSGPLSLNYNYEYTLFDNEGVGQGSHAITLIHEFDRKHELPTYTIPDEFKADFTVPDKSMDVEAKFYVYSLVDRLEIIEKKLTRVIDPNVTPEQLSQLSLYEVGVLDSSRAESASPFEEKPVDLALISAKVDPSLSEDYEEFIKDISDNINKEDVETRVITPKHSYLRAAGIRQHFNVDSLNSKKLAFLEPMYKNDIDSVYASQKLGNRAIAPFERLTHLSSQFTTFQITPVTDVGNPKAWRLLIRNEKGKDIRTFEGVGMPVAEIKWDWRTEAGAVVTPGMYSYQLEWQDDNAQSHTTSPKYINVQKLLRHITIEITDQQKGIGVDANEIDIILKQ